MSRWSVASRLSSPWCSRRRSTQLTLVCLPLGQRPGAPRPSTASGRLVIHRARVRRLYGRYARRAGAHVEVTDMGVAANGSSADVALVDIS